MKKLRIILLIMMLVCVSVSTTTVTASAKTSYYCTWLNRTRGTTKGSIDQWYAGTNKVTYTSNSITLYGTVWKVPRLGGKVTKKNYLKYGKRTFRLTPTTKYLGADDDKYIKYSKASFLKGCKRLPYLGLTIKVKNGKVVSMVWSS